MIRETFNWIMTKANEVIALYEKAMKATILLPFAKIDRDAYIRKTFASTHSEEEIDSLLADCPSVHCSAEAIESISKKEIINHAMLTALLSALTAIPNGIAMIPLFLIDIIQFQVFTFIISQKIIYLYRKPQECGLSDSNLSDGLMFIMTTIMIGKQKITRVLKSVSGTIIKKAIQQYTSKIITRLAIFSTMRQATKWIGISITKEGIDLSSEILVTTLCAIVSGTISFWLFYPMARNLFISLKNGHNIMVAEPTAHQIQQT